jgi:hypothetical protein
LKFIKFLIIPIVGLFFTNCSSPEKSKIVDIYTDGSPKEIEVYAGNPPKRYLSKIIFLSSLGDTSMTINVEDGDTLMSEIKKEIETQTFDNGNKMIVQHWTILGHSETLTEVHYFDNMGDILQVDDKINGTLRKYAELHEDLKQWQKPNEPFKNYLHGKWDVSLKNSSKKYIAEFKGSAYSIAELDKIGEKKWEEFHSVNYLWNFELGFRMLNKGFPKESIKAGKRENFVLHIDTKYKFLMEGNSNKYLFSRQE